MRKSIGLEQYFTPKEEVRKCVEVVNPTRFSRIIEPSAGAGAFLSFLPTHAVGVDIFPLREDILREDFLKMSIARDSSLKTLVIGNPPFGIRGSLALKFIAKAATFADTIAFILPRSFCKPSLQNKVHLNFHLEHEHEVNHFELPTGEEVKVSCVFQI